MSVMSTLKTGAKVASTFIKKKSPVLLIITGTVALGFTVYSAVKAVKKYDALEGAELHKKHEEGYADAALTKKEKVKCAAKAGWKVILYALIAISCFAGSAYIQHSRTVAAVAAASVTSAALNDLKSSMAENLSEEIQNKVTTGAAEKAIKRKDKETPTKNGAPIPKDLNNIGDVYPVMDPYTGQTAYIKLSDIDIACAKLNAEISNAVLQDESVDLNFFLEKLNFNHSLVGTYFVFDRKHKRGQAKITLSQTAEIDNDGKPWFVLNYTGNFPYYDETAVPF